MLGSQPTWPLYLKDQDEFGAVEAGRRADLVLLEGNPLEDIGNTRQIAGLKNDFPYVLAEDRQLPRQPILNGKKVAW